MSRKIRTQQKQILHLDSRLVLPTGKSESNEAILALLSSLRKEKVVILGINAVSRAIIQKKVKYIVFACDINPPEIIEHLLTMAATSKLPVIPTKISSKEMGLGLGGFKSAAVVGIMNTCSAGVDEVLAPFCHFMSSAGLPFICVETDIFVPTPKNAKKN